MRMFVSGPLLLKVEYADIRKVAGMFPGGAGADPASKKKKKIK